jgi:hypothetical protein
MSETKKQIAPGMPQILLKEANDQRHRKNRPEDTFDCMWLKCHDSPPGCAVGDLRGGNRERGVSHVTLRAR